MLEEIKTEEYVEIPSIEELRLSHAKQAISLAYRTFFGREPYVEEENFHIQNTINDSASFVTILQKLRLTGDQSKPIQQNLLMCPVFTNSETRYFNEKALDSLSPFARQALQRLMHVFSDKEWAQCD